MNRFFSLVSGRYGRIVLCGFLLLLSNVFRPPFSEAADDIFESYRSQGIVVAQAVDMPPMSFVGPSGRPSGFIIDFWKKWSSETGIPVRFHLVEWADTLTAVSEGIADVHGGLFYTFERDSFLDYSTPFFPSRGAVILHRDSLAINTAQLAGKRVGVIDKSFYDNFIRKKFPQMKPVPFESTMQLAEAAVKGEVDAVIGDYPTVMYQIGSMGMAKEFRVLEFVSEQQFRAAVAQGNIYLLKIVNEGAALIDDEERHVLLSRWVVSGHITPHSWLVPAILISVFSLGLALFVPFLFDKFRR